MSDWIDWERISFSFEAMESDEIFRVEMYFVYEMQSNTKRNQKQTMNPVNHQRSFLFPVVFLFIFAQSFFHIFAWERLHISNLCIECWGHKWKNWILLGIVNWANHFIMILEAIEEVIQRIRLSLWVKLLTPLILLYCTR